MDSDSPRPQSPSPAQPTPPGSGTEWAGIQAEGDLPREIFGLPVLAEIPRVEPRPRTREWQPKKRWRLGLVLFLLTCASMWLSGSHALVFLEFRGWPIPILLFDRLLASDGPLFVLAMMSTLFAHEMGHYLQTLRYRVPADVPFFIPFPLSPIGTMGAVILMGGRNRNRKELFDIGLSGPLAGLIVILPFLLYGVKTAAASPASLIVDWENTTGYYPDCLLVKWAIAWLRPELLPHQQLDLSPFLLAGWGATLLTGVNMLPISQLDGGHVAYALFGKRAHWLARASLLAAGIYIIVSQDYGWSLMFALTLFLLRPDHPPTHNDAAPLGWPRWILGFISLFIPVICLAPLPKFG